MFTLKLNTGWEQKVEEKLYDTSGKKDKYVSRLSKKQVKEINKLIMSCSVKEDKDDYMLYVLDDRKHW